MKFVTLKKYTKQNIQLVEISNEHNKKCNYGKTHKTNKLSLLERMVKDKYMRIKKKRNSYK